MALKGSYLSPETKAKISSANKGHSHSMTPETKALLSVINSGKRLSEETKERIRQAAIRRFSDSEARKKASEQTKRLWQDPAYREKNVAACKGRQCSLKTRARMSASHKGLKHSSESIAKMSVLSKKRGISPNTRKAQLEWAQSPEGQERKHIAGRRQFEECPEHYKNMQAKSRSPDARKKISDALKKRWQDVAYRQRMSEQSQRLWQDDDYIVKTCAKRSEINRRLWADEEYRNRLLPHLAAVRRPTCIEKILFAFLCQTFGSRIVEREYRIGSYFVDFAVPDLMLAFEADGERWHRLPELDRQRDKDISHFGYDVIRYPEEELLGWLKKA